MYSKEIARLSSITYSIDTNATTRLSVLDLDLTKHFAHQSINYQCSPHVETSTLINLYD